MKPPFHKKISLKTTVLFFFIIIFMMGLDSVLLAQSSKSLKVKRKKLEKEIAYTNKLLKETRKNKRNTLYELQLLQKKISSRNELISMLKKEAAELDKKIFTTRSDIKIMDKNLEQMKKDYSKILLFLSRHNNDLDKLIFLFSAEDLNQAYQRLRYMDEMLRFIRSQADTIQNMEQHYKNELEDLNRQKAEKEKLLKKENEQVLKIKKNMQEKNKLNKNLARKEKQLLARLREKQKEAKKLNKKIEDIIAKETRPKKTSAGKSVNTVTKEDIKLAEEFSRNKGKLPWPVDNGFVSEKFGTHTHPVLKHVKINNNGINIATSSGSKAKAVFKGKVVSVVEISNTNKAVIVKHGNWFTVYSNLDNIYVKRNEAVNTGDVLGKIHTNIKGKTELHFEIWYGKKKQNPAYWIRRK